MPSRRDKITEVKDDLRLRAKFKETVIMTLLQEIQTGSVDGKTNLPTLLRKCRILAARLKNEEFKNWVQHELDGYPGDAALPDYRKMRTQSFGHFLGSFGSGLKNAPIPLSCIPEQYRDFVSTVEFRDGISALQDLITHGEGILQERWPADLIALVANRIYQNMNLAQGWKEIPSSTLVGVLDTVRNRVLNFVLEIESVAPNAGEGTFTANLPPEKITNVFNTYIMGNVGNIAEGSSHVSQHAAVTVNQNDWSSLEKFLKSLSVEHADIEELKDAIKQEPKAMSTGFGQKVSSWIDKMIAKSAQGIWNVTTTVASNLLSKALAQYYGLTNQ